MVLPRDETSMTQVMSGFRVVEVASYTFVPSAGAVLADWGADVLKIEHPQMPDPQRGLYASGWGGPGPIPNSMVQIGNRGKRSVAIDMKTEGGHDVLLKLAATSDVFLTNFLPETRARLKIDVDDIRSANP